MRCWQGLCRHGGKVWFAGAKVNHRQRFAHCAPTHPLPLLRATLTSSSRWWSATEAMCSPQLVPCVLVQINPSCAPTCLRARCPSDARHCSVHDSALRQPDQERLQPLLAHQQRLKCLDAASCSSSAGPPNPPLSTASLPAAVARATGRMQSCASRLAYSHRMTPPCSPAAVKLPTSAGRSAQAEAAAESCARLASQRMPDLATLPPPTYSASAPAGGRRMSASQGRCRPCSRAPTPEVSPGNNRRRVTTTSSWLPGRTTPLL